MAYVNRTYTRGYCNRAVGSPTGRELAVAATALPPVRFPEAAFLQSPVTITTMSRSGTTVSVNAVGHGLAVGDIVFISGSVQTGYHGPWRVSVVTDADNFEFQTPYSTATPATGSPVCQKTIS